MYRPALRRSLSGPLLMRPFFNLFSGLAVDVGILGHRLRRGKAPGG